MSVTTEPEASAASTTDSPTNAPGDDGSQHPTSTVMPWTQRLKYAIVKCVNTAGLSFLSPLVLLAYREEPLRQLKEILRLIVAPAAAFGVFLYLWTIIAPLHKTKSGEVPTPAVVWDAAGSIWTFHVREGEKEQAVIRGGAWCSSAEYCQSGFRNTQRRKWREPCMHTIPK